MPESVSFDRVANRYDETRGYPPEVAVRIAEGLLEVGGVPAGGSILEIGIGTGRIALPLLACGVNITGVDIAPRMLEQLRVKYDELRAADGSDGAARAGALTVQIADMTALPFADGGVADGGFDAVVAVHVLHLVPEWRHALDEALRVVRPTGALLIGQDTTGATAPSPLGVQDRWREIMLELGATPKNVGAAGYDAIFAEVQRRGLPLEEHVLASWERDVSPRQILTTITERLWSRTWNVPDDLFQESVRRLTAWVDARYGSAIDAPVAVEHSFKVARVAPE